MSLGAFDLGVMTKQAGNMLASMGGKLTVHQPRYNMLDRRIEDGLTDVLLRKGIGAEPDAGQAEHRVQAQ